MPDLIVSQKVDDFMRTTTAAQMRAVLEAVQLNGALGTPSSGVATNLTGTAAGLTAGAASSVALGGITGLGTGVATALGVNTGSAGAVILFNGALGTPSSGVVTNLTGTASININGTVGANTPAAGTFTTGIFTGSVGVNVAAGVTPFTEFEVDSTVTTSPRGIMSAQFTTSTDGARLHMRKARGTRAVPTTIVTGDTLGRIVASGYDGSNYLEDATIIFGTEGTVAATRIATNIQFWTATDAAPSVLTEAARITAARNLLIGGTTDITGSGGVKIFGNTDASSITTGALIVGGGVGINNKLWVGSTSNFAGTVTVNANNIVGTGNGTINLTSGGVFIQDASARRLTITGTNATLNTTLQFSSTNAVQFGATALGSIKVSADTTAGNLTFTAPSTGTYAFAGTNNMTTGGSITTGAPSGGTAGAWKHGIRVAATVSLDTTQYVQLDVGGTLYKMAIAA